MNIMFAIRNIETNEFVGNKLLDIEQATFADKETALEFLNHVYEYGVKYEIVELYYSYKSNKSL